MPRHFYHNKTFQKGVKGPLKLTQEQLLEFNKIVMICTKCGPLKKGETYQCKLRKIQCRCCKLSRNIKKSENHIAKFLVVNEKL